MIFIRIFRGHRIACKKGYPPASLWKVCIYLCLSHARGCLLPSSEIGHLHVHIHTPHSRSDCFYLLLCRVTPLSPFNAKVRMSETTWITTYSWRVNDHCRPVCFMSAIAIKGSGKAGALHYWRHFPTLHIWQSLLMYWCCIGVDCRRLSFETPAYMTRVGTNRCVEKGPACLIIPSLF
jgi:hypothetical protein